MDTVTICLTLVSQCIDVRCYSPAMRFPSIDSWQKLLILIFSPVKKNFARDRKVNGKFCVR